MGKIFDDFGQEEKEFNDFGTNDFNDFGKEDEKQKIKKIFEYDPIENTELTFGDEFQTAVLDTEAMFTNPIYQFIEARRDGKGLGESFKAGYQGFKDFFTYPAKRAKSRFTNDPIPEQPKDLFDIFEDQVGLSPWIELPLAFAGSVALDPKDWVSFGSTAIGDLASKLSKGTRQALDAADSANEATKVLENAEQPIKQGTKLYDEVIELFNKGQKFSIEDTLQKQAEAGQIGLININPPLGGKTTPLVKGEKAFKKMDDIAEWAKTNPLIKEARKAFITKPDGVSDTAWDLAKKYDHSSSYYTKQNATDPGYKYRDEFDQTIQNTEYQPEDIFDLGEYPQKYSDAPEDIRKMVEEKHWQKAEDIIQKERELGLKAEELTGEYEYMPRIMTDEARKALKENSPDLYKKMFKQKDGKLVFDPHTLERTPQFKRLRASQINKLNNVGRFESMFGNYKGKVFIDDPVVAQTLRNIRHEVKINNAQFLHELINKGLDEGFVVKVGENSKIPKGFKQIDNPNVYEDIVKGYAFRGPEAKLIEGKVEKVLPDEFENISNVYRKGIQAWKKGNLLFGGSWYEKNAIGNLWRMFQNGFTSPKTLKESMSLVKDLRMDNAIGGTIKTARGEMKLSDVVDELAKRGVLSQGMVRDVQKDLSKGLSQKGIAGNLLQKAEKVGFGIHQLEEDTTRLAMALDAVKKGYNLDEAAKISNETLFDYQDLTDTEKNIKKYLSPFYTYYRKNLPYQAKKMFENPQAPSMLRKGRKAVDSYFDQQEGDIGYIPEYQREGAPLRIDENDVLPLAGKLPQYELYNLLKNPAHYVFSKATPLISVPANIAYGKDYFTGSEIDKNDPLAIGQTVLNSWAPTSRASDIIEGVINTMNDNTDQPFTEGVGEDLMDFINTFNTQDYTGTERNMMKGSELRELQGQLSTYMRNASQAENSALKSYYEMLAQQTLEKIRNIASLD